MVPELILIALLVGWLMKGSFWRLADAHIRYGWMIFIPLGLYVGSWVLTMIVEPGKLAWVFSGSAIIEKCALIVVALANIRMPGMKLVLLGIVLNLLALSANHGLMPADPSALDAAFGSGYAAHAKNAVHVRSALMDASTELGFLCDTIAAHRPFALCPAVYSVGDLVMSVGIFAAIIALMRGACPQPVKVKQEEAVGSERA